MSTVQAAGNNSSPDGTNPPPAAWWAGLRRLVLPAAAILAVVAIVVVFNHGWAFWVSEAAVQSTDDAYIEANVSTMSARVSGNVLNVLVHDFQPVKAGEVLVEIDPADYQAAVDGAQAAVAGAQAALSNLANQETLQRALLEQAKAQHESSLAAQTWALEERNRQQTLVQGGIAGTEQKLQQAMASYDEAVANVAATNASTQAQQAQLDVLVGQEGTLRATLDAARANLKTAQLKLGYTSVIAPFDGVASTRRVQAGDYVNIGTSLISVVPVPNVYVIANFKETQLTHVASGQPVELTVDTFPGEVLRGHVGRLSPASGAVFSLLPPDNATGNFTKVVQRIPVRIEIDPGQALTNRLRAGMSVEAHIHVDGGR
ncbi:membrane fusion protein (multidrug efflux system) [Angulomicrobium tetraedrale]|uniref:Membrane fusion protein (Multidrug efflux system) n=1 Tax=Ancylobacter tetraedralis TaxID=217068 RepID=A0A839ZAG4_9HYPH|nr:HlyD family secretion protein [Ancylobacter tetraedralis]MBB3771716.1 membrane fusion protein (multidrug efflux system) [Ancylobacter tetraedralis]